MDMPAMSMSTIIVSLLALYCATWFHFYFFTEMNLSHIITEFSFGPYFPEIVQPLDNSFESTDKRAFRFYINENAY